MLTRHRDALVVHGAEQPRVARDASGQQLPAELIQRVVGHGQYDSNGGYRMSRSLGLPPADAINHRASGMLVEIGEYVDPDDVPALLRHLPTFKL